MSLGQRRKGEGTGSPRREGTPGSGDPRGKRAEGQLGGPGESSLEEKLREPGRKGLRALSNTPDAPVNTK